jgi:hypothetical protein
LELNDILNSFGRYERIIQGFYRRGRENTLMGVNIYAFSEGNEQTVNIGRFWRSRMSRRKFPFSKYEDTLLDTHICEVDTEQKLGIFRRVKMWAKGGCAWNYMGGRFGNWKAG